MKYKLIHVNKQDTEHLCDKITIDGFDYYLGDIMTTTSWMFYGNRYNLKELHQYEIGIDNLEFLKEQGIKSVIATTNPNINIPYVISNVGRAWEEVANSYTHKNLGVNPHAFRLGYHKSQQTHPFTEEDMIEFDDWKNENYKYHNYLYVKKDDYYSVPELNLVKHYTTKELLRLWKEQQPKVIYYNG